MNRGACVWVDIWWPVNVSPLVTVNRLWRAKAHYLERRAHATAARIHRLFWSKNANYTRWGDSRSALWRKGSVGLRCPPRRLQFKILLHKMPVIFFFCVFHFILHLLRWIIWKWVEEQRQTNTLFFPSVWVQTLKKKKRRLCVDRENALRVIRRGIIFSVG